MRNKSVGSLKDRGVALLIVLVVTALMIALVFEFAYDTRVSVRAAMNFRDGQRAYYLARSGVNFAGMLLSDNKKNNKLQDNLEQQEWQIVPIISGGDTELRVRWEDERGKINITSIREGGEAYNRLVQLFTSKGINQDILSKISDEKMTFRIVDELHQVMSDEEYPRVENYVTTAPGGNIDVNTASPEVLQSMGISPGTVEMIVDARQRTPFKNRESIANFSGIKDVKTQSNNLVSSFLTETSDHFKVYSHATVGEYTKQVVAIIMRTASGFDVLYWRAL